MVTLKKNRKKKEWFLWKKRKKETDRKKPKGLLIPLVKV
jgi:hypothetical protein